MAEWTVELHLKIFTCQIEMNDVLHQILDREIVISNLKA